MHSTNIQQAEHGEALFSKETEEVRESLKCIFLVNENVDWTMFVVAVIIYDWTIVTCAAST